MEYILLAYLAVAASGPAIPSDTRTIVMDSAAQCTTALGVWDATDGSGDWADGACLNVGAGSKVNLTVFASTATGRYFGDIGYGKYTSAAACAAAETAIEASNPALRAGCIVAPLNAVIY